MAKLLQSWILWCLWSTEYSPVFYGVIQGSLGGGLVPREVCDDGNCGGGDEGGGSERGGGGERDIKFYFKSIFGA